MTNAVEEFYANYTELLALLQPNQYPSLNTWAQNSFRRILVIIMANHLENEIKGIVREFSKNKSGSDLVSSFIEKSMNRQYNNYFDWDRNNCNKFFSYFGQTFKQEAMKDVSSNKELEEGIKAFLEIGNARNILAHERLHQANIGDKTTKEFYDAFKRAMVFIEYLKKKLE